MTLRSRSGRHGDLMLRRAASAFVRSPAPFSWPSGLKIACPEERATTIASPSRPIGETFCPSAGWVGRNGTRGAGGIEWHGMFGRSERKSTNKQHSTICFLRKDYFVTNAEKHNPEIRRGSPRRRSSRSLSQAAPPFCQSERTVSRAPAYQILWVRGFRAHTISRRGFNLFKPLRRHFRATPFCRQVLSRRDPGDRNGLGSKDRDRLGSAHWAPRPRSTHCNMRELIENE